MNPPNPNAERDRLAEEYCDQSRCAQVTRDDKAWHRMKAAWLDGYENCLTSLKGVPEFDQQAAHDAAKKLASSEHPDLIAIIHAIAIEGARWQFDQMAARVALSDHSAKLAWEEVAVLQERAEALEREAKLEHLDADRLAAEKYELQDKLTAAELECKQWAEEAKEQAVEFVNMRDKLAAAEARAKMFEEFYRDECKMRIQDLKDVK